MRKKSKKPQKWRGKPVTQYSASAQCTGTKSGRKRSKQIVIDREETLAEVQTFCCCSHEFTIIRTWNKAVQGQHIQRDNICYTGRDKKYRKCGKRNCSDMPSWISGKQFSPELKSWLSVLRYDCRMSEQLGFHLRDGIRAVSAVNR
jgi:hypothetical protein